LPIFLISSAGFAGIRPMVRVLLFLLYLILLCVETPVLKSYYYRRYSSSGPTVVSPGDSAGGGRYPVRIFNLEFSFLCLLPSQN